MPAGGADVCCDVLAGTVVSGAVAVDVAIGGEPPAGRLITGLPVARAPPTKSGSATGGQGTPRSVPAIAAIFYLLAPSMCNPPTASSLTGPSDRRP